MQMSKFKVYPQELHTHTHTQRERERERERNTHTHTHTLYAACFDICYDLLELTVTPTISFRSKPLVKKLSKITSS